MSFAENVAEINQSNCWSFITIGQIEIDKPFLWVANLSQLIDLTRLFFHCCFLCLICLKRFIRWKWVVCVWSSHFLMRHKLVINHNFNGRSQSEFNIPYHCSDSGNHLSISSLVDSISLMAVGDREERLTFDCPPFVFVRHHMTPSWIVSLFQFRFWDFDFGL